MLARLAVLVALAGCHPTTPHLAPSATGALPTPPGPAPIGRRTLVVSTPARELVVEVWYPAAAAPGDGTPYTIAPAAYRDAIAALTGIDAAELPLLDGVRTHAHRDAAVAPGRHPLVVFAPGYGGPANQNTILAEDLASHGYVFASVAFTGESVLVERPDGTTVPIDGAQVERFLGEAGGSAPHFQAWMAATDPATRATERAAFVAASPVAQERAAAWRDQLVAVVAAAARWDGDDAVLRGHVATARTAIVGMSFGGGVAAAACAATPSCVASANLDGFAPGASEVAPAHPHLVLEAPPGGASDDLLAAAAPVWRVRIDGTTHLDYTDLVLLAPKLSLHGSVPGPELLAIVDPAVRGLVDCYVRGGGPAFAPAPGARRTIGTSPAARATTCAPRAD